MKFNNTDLKKIAVLSLIASIENVVKNNDKIKPGRFLGKLRELAKIIHIPNIHISDAVKIKKKIEKFEIESGWHGKEKNLATLINFCLILAEHYKLDSKIITLLSEVWDYINRKYPVPAACDWSGDVAFKKWEAIDIMSNTI